MAFVSVDGDFTPRGDLKEMLGLYRPEAVVAANNYTKVSINNGTLRDTPLTKREVSQFTAIEGTINAQVMLSMGWPLKMTSYSVGG